MTVTAPTTSTPPSPRRFREWAVAIVQSVGCTLVGLLLWLIIFGFLLEEFHDDPPVGLLAMTGMDALVGAAAGLAIGPARFLHPGRLHSVVHLLLAMSGGLSVWALPASAIALYRLGMRRRPVLDVSVLVVIGVASMVTMLLDSWIRSDPMGTFVLLTILVMIAGATIPLLIGRVVGTRDELLASLRDRAASSDRERETAQREREAAEREAAALVRERDADAARVRAEERAALARDMHDSISHHLATIAMHAGAMSYREDLPPQELRRTAGTVRDAAQQANRELRTVLLTLRTTEGDAPLATAPTLCDIVERCREENQDVELTWDGVTADALAAHDRSAVVTLARILTEVTTNAAKHAPGEPLRITLSRTDDHVVLRARNPCPASAATGEASAAPTSTGHGLLGVQERARLLGGDARYGVNDGAFEVEAWMPW
ncbi:sensor histidine kinase [Brachybacterium sp. FME24]|uniref:sensor histidine kinase n=1 Tax=Brachybacterium sp. FME24 TaxID=2742605 RepID=UPI001867B7CC|nr:histidine kinase [Brachybacterium sp. FME24]